MKSLEDFSILSKETEVNIKFLLREYLQKFIILYLSNSDFFSEGVFQGGTCIRIIYNSQRFSEDLDFVFKDKNLKSFLNLREYFYGIEKFLSNKIIFLDKVKINFQRESNDFKRYKLNFNIEKIGQININLEFANIPSYLNKTEVLSFEIFDFPIKVETKEEILIDKIVAFGLRDYIKGRDIWDINFIKKDINELDYNILSKKIRDYGKEVNDFIKGTYKNLEIVNKKGIEILESEMKRFLPSKIFYYIKNDFNSIIEDFYKFIGNIVEEIKWS